MKMNKDLSVFNLSNTGLKMSQTTQIMESAKIHPNLRRIDLSRNDLSIDEQNNLIS